MPAMMEEIVGVVGRATAVLVGNAAHRRENFVFLVACRAGKFVNYVAAEFDDDLIRGEIFRGAPPQLIKREIV